jgi:heat shock transcription factor
LLTYRSFLDNNKNENLIRWSDDGNSFIVIDEDEFARTLIPELFKHNNYASFVRQLNMYGFHKKVGLSDNSMKASETKAKAPSEYFNKYFKRGRPELLWLIQKPKNPTAGPKRKREDGEKGDSDEERKYVQDTGGGGGYVEELTVRGNDQVAMIPRSEYNNLRVEVRQLQDQQKLISSVLSTIKRQNEELYSRATSFQALHERHENSINAILTFLATFYNRSLEGNANGLNLADMFPAARQQHHGNVVDVDEFPAQEMQMNKSPHLQRKKQPLALLPAPPVGQPDLLSAAGGRASTMTPTRPAASPLTRSNSRQQSVFKSPLPNRQPSFENTMPSRDASSSVPLKVESPANPPSLLENDAIMSAIQNANANAGTTSQAPQFDFPAALSNYQTAGGHVPLTPQERNSVLSMMAGNTDASTTNNALTNPNPPEIQRLMNDLSQYQATQKQLEILQQMSDEQNSRVQSLQERLQPLSPSGQIPGLSDNEYFGNATGTLGEPGQYDLDLDSFVQDQDYFSGNADANGANNSAGLPDFNFDNATPDLGGGAFDATGADAFNFNTSDGNHLNVDDASGYNNDNRVESVSSNATSPAATVEEVEDESRRKSPPKRRKR